MRITQSHRIQPWINSVGRQPKPERIPLAPRDAQAFRKLEGTLKRGVSQGIVAARPVPFGLKLKKALPVAAAVSVVGCGTDVRLPADFLELTHEQQGQAVVQEVERLDSLTHMYWGLSIGLIALALGYERIQGWIHDGKSSPLLSPKKIIFPKMRGFLEFRDYLGRARMQAKKGLFEGVDKFIDAARQTGVKYGLKRSERMVESFVRDELVDMAFYQSLTAFKQVGRWRFDKLLGKALDYAKMTGLEINPLRLKDLYRATFDHTWYEGFYEEGEKRLSAEQYIENARYFAGQLGIPVKETMIQKIYEKSYEVYSQPPRYFDKKRIDYVVNPNWRLADIKERVESARVYARKLGVVPDEAGLQAMLELYRANDW